VLTSLGLPGTPDELLGAHVATLDEALRYVGGRLAANTDVRVDEAGKIHVSSDKAIAEPPSLVDLRKRVAAMLPRVDVGEAILEVMGWVPEFLGSLTALSGGASRMAGLDVTVAACLTSQALNIGYGPVAEEGVATLQRRRLGHVGRTYLRAADYTAANPHLIAKQAGIGFARALGGGLVATIDGMRFVVPVPSLFAKPNRKYFGPKRGMTWLNAINDQAFGTAHKIVAGTDRDCLHAIDLFFNSGAADLPEVLITDTGSYSDLVFGIAQLLGVDYRPALADLPDQKGWRADSGADYAILNTFARGKLDLDRVRRHWDEILRLIASIYTSQVSACTTWSGPCNTMGTPPPWARRSPPTAASSRPSTSCRSSTVSPTGAASKECATSKRGGTRSPRRYSTVADVNCSSDTGKGWKTSSAPWASS